MEALSGVNLSRFAPFYFIRYQKRGRKPSRAALVFSHAGKGTQQMARNLNYIYALIEYVENTDGYIYRVFDNYFDAAVMERTLEKWKDKYEPQRKVSYKIEIYKKGG